jgi:cold shock protein
MPRGVVKWFSDRKGFGFLTVDGLESEVFVHYLDIKMEGYRSLNQDMVVDFDLAYTDKGYLARNVVPVLQSVTIPDEAEMFKINLTGAGLEN